MWLYSRRLFLTAIGAGGLAACGFTPVYGPSGGAAKLQNTVMVQAPQTRAEFELVRTLEQHFGPANAQQYKFTYDLTMEEEAVVIAATRELQRYNIIGELKYTLTDGGDNQIAAGRTSAFTSYSATGTVIANSSAQKDAENRLTVILAGQAIADMHAQVFQ